MTKNVSPYGVAAMEYYQAGWVPLWLPYAKKFPPPYGYTGAAAVSPSEEVLFLDWMETPGNVALKMTDNLIGLDFDRNKETGEQTGWAKFEELTALLGPLPLTVVSSSRESLRDGFTAFFVVPEGIKWKSGIAGVMDIIRGGHRYQVVSPSVHPDTGRAYEWRSFEDNRATPFIPLVESLPELPAAWIDFLTIEATKVEKVAPAEQEDKTPADINFTGVACSAMRKKLNELIEKLGKSELSRHDSMISAVMIFVLMAHSGHAGAGMALETYQRRWMGKFTTKEKEARDLAGEFEKAVTSAATKVEGKGERACRCGRGSGSPLRPVRSMSDIRRY